MRSMVQPTTGIRESKAKTRAVRPVSRAHSDQTVSLDTTASLSSLTSLSSMESLSSSKTRDKSRSRDMLDIPQQQSSYSWRRNFNNLLKEENVKEKSDGKISSSVPRDSRNVSSAKDKTSRRLSNIVENFNQQSPSLSILQIKLAGESRLTGKAHNELPNVQETVRKYSTKTKDVEKSTFDVDVQEKREIFEGKHDEDHRPRLRKLRRQESLESKPKSGREKWAEIREKHCPITAALVNQDKGKSLRSSILGDQKISFKNLKFSKQPIQRGGREDTSVAGSAEFEDTATEILHQMRKQRRSLQMEYVAKVSVPAATKKVTTGWRDRIGSGPVKGGQLHCVPSTNVTNSPDTVSTVTKPAPNLVVNDEPKDQTPTLPKFTNPLEFILMREEYVKKNPPAKKIFFRGRSVESDSEGEMSMESVMKSLKKIVKAINPKREFPQDKQEKERQEKTRVEQMEVERRKRRDELLNKSKANRHSIIWDERMRKYHGANIVPFNSHAARWNSCHDLLEEQRIIDKKAVRERIKNRVLSSVNQALENKTDEIFSYCESKEFNIRGKLKITPTKYKLSRHTTEQELITVYECVGFRKRELPDIIAHFSNDKEKTKKKSTAHVKQSLHGVTDSKTDRYLFAVITRTNDLWETVKPINVAVKIKTELFAPKSNPIVKVRAKVSFEMFSVAITRCEGTSGSTSHCEQHKWDALKGCALFSIVGEQIIIFSILAKYIQSSKSI